jgi:hypothetical protein
MWLLMVRIFRHRVVICIFTIHGSKPFPRICRFWRLLLPRTNECETDFGEFCWWNKVWGKRVWDTNERTRRGCSSGNILFSPTTLFNLPNFRFYPCIFLVQIHWKLQKIHSEVRIKDKKNSENAFRSLKLGTKIEIQENKESCRWKRKFRSSSSPQLNHRFEFD